MSGDHTKFFENKAPVLFIGEEGERQGEESRKRGDPRADRQRARRAQLMPKMVQDALVNRVTEPAGDMVYHATWDEFMAMRKDPAFTPSSKYTQLLFFYANGAPRPQPIRRLLEHEVGTIKTPALGFRVVCLKTNPGERFSGRVLNVPVQLARPLAIEPDPFPSPKLAKNGAIAGSISASSGISGLIKTVKG